MQGAAPLGYVAGIGACNGMPAAPLPHSPDQTPVYHSLASLGTSAYAPQVHPPVHHPPMQPVAYPPQPQPEGE